MTAWRIGIETDFSVSVGMWGKQFRKYLSPERYERYRKTYPDGDYAHFWEAVSLPAPFSASWAGRWGRISVMRIP